MSPGDDRAANPAIPANSRQGQVSILSVDAQETKVRHVIVEALSHRVRQLHRTRKHNHQRPYKFTVTFLWRENGAGTVSRGGRSSGSRAPTPAITFQAVATGSTLLRIGNSRRLDRRTGKPDGPLAGQHRHLGGARVIQALFQGRAPLADSLVDWQWRPLSRAPRVHMRDHLPAIGLVEEVAQGPRHPLGFGQELVIVDENRIGPAVE